MRLPGREGRDQEETDEPEDEGGRQRRWIR